MDIKTVGELLAEYISGVAVLNDRQEVIWANHVIEKICEKKQIINEDFSSIFPVSLDEIIDRHKTIKTLSGNKYTIKARRINGENYIYTLIFIDEITDFSNKETKLYCLEQIIDSINDGVLISDYEGRIVLYNKAHEKLEDLSANEIIGKYLWEAYNYNPEMSEHRKVYKTLTPIIERYQAHSFKDGIPKYVSYSTFPIIKDGEPIAVYSISKNETRLQTLLSETIELKRKLFSKVVTKEEQRFNNGTSFNFSDIIGDSQMMKNLIREAQTMALLDSTVLIVGETGTGKEVFSQSIHNYCKNHNEPFVAINCAAIPENLLESILFGTVKGAYTGAVNQSGLFEEARNGTLFLDELNSMPVPMQSKLLRVLQERAVRRVGGLNNIPVQCRVIAAVNEEPLKLIREGKLRQDLFYRIAELCLYIPPLRERHEDIISTSEVFINKYNKLLNKKVKSLSRELREIIINYKWPGNVRELEHVIENMMIRAGDNQAQLVLDDMPLYIRNVILGPDMVSRSTGIHDTTGGRASLPAALRNLERNMILEKLNKNNWNLSQTAKDLDIIRQSLEYRMKKLNIKRPER